MTAYRTPSYPPKEPVVVLPFAQRYPRVYVCGKETITAFIGLVAIFVVIAVPIGFASGLGWLVQRCGFYTGVPFAAAALMTILDLVFVAVVGGFAITVVPMVFKVLHNFGKIVLNLVKR